jgi:MinD superfamily P-loop ATPase
MGPGEENSGKLVTEVRRKAKELARELNLKYILTDGPPGTGCATIASVTGSDATLVVIEPSISSLHDAERVIELVQKFKIPVYALINKASINPEMGAKIARFLKSKSVPLLGEIPFDKSMVQAMIQELSINEYQPESEISATINKVWTSLSESGQ